MKARLFALIQHADKVACDGVEIEDFVYDTDSEVRLDFQEQSWAFQDQEVDINKEGFARAKDTEGAVHDLTFMCEVPLPLMYPDPSTLTTD